jgi:hypothetical protein
VWQIPAAEETDLELGARCGKGFLASDGVVDRFASVLLGPDTGESAEPVMRGAKADAVLRWREVVSALSGRAPAAEIHATDVAAELLLGRHIEAAMQVAGTDKAVLVRVDAEALRQHEASAKCVPQYEPSGRLKVGEIRQPIEYLEVGELIIRREARMRLGRALVLRDLADGFVGGPQHRYATSIGLPSTVAQSYIRPPDAFALCGMASASKPLARIVPR